MCKYTLFDYQKQNVNFCLEHSYVLVGDEMGLGKTLVGIDLIRRLKVPTLIICPAVLKINWRNEIEHFLEREAKIPAKKDDVSADEIIIINYEMLKDCGHFFQGRSLIICDEAHYLKNCISQRTKAAFLAISYYRPEWLLMLSGTPIKNRVLEFYSLLWLLDQNPRMTNGARLHHHFECLMDFCKHFAMPVKKMILGRPTISWEGLQNEDDLKELLKDKYIRHTCEEVLDLPSLVQLYKTVDVEVPFGSLESDLALAFAMAEVGKKSEFISRVKRCAATSKTYATAQYTENIIEQGAGPVLVFSDHVEATDMISRFLSKKCYQGAIITGQQNVEIRAALVKKFQNGELDYLCCTIPSMGIGWTLTKARHVVFNDASWVPADLDQAVKRIHRIGQTEKCFVHYLCFGDVDKMIYRTISNKRSVIDAIQKKGN